MGQVARDQGAMPERSFLRAVAAQARPKSVVRNALVFLGPLMTGMLGEPGVAWHCLTLMVPWVLASAGTYALNDCFDEAADRAAVALNPRDERGRRPLMRNELTGEQVRTFGITWLLAALVAAAEFGPWVVAMVAGYTVVNLGRSWAVNRDPALIRRATLPDLSIVSAGFVVRLASVAPGVPSAAPRWPTYIAVFAGAMVVSAGKRLAKLRATEDPDGPQARLVNIMRVAAAVTCVTFPLAGYMIRSEPLQAVLIFFSAIAYSVAVRNYARHPPQNPLEILDRRVRGAAGEARREWSVIVPAVAAAVLFSAAVYLL